MKVNLVTFLDNTIRIFWLVLEAPRGFIMDVCMHWFGNLSVGWEGYITGSIDALTRIVTLSPGAHAHLHIQGIKSWLLYVPLLHLNHLGELVIDGGLTAGILLALMHLSPTLRLLVVLDFHPSRVEAEVIQVLKTCLMRRCPGLELHMNGQVDGSSQDIPLPLLAAARGVPERRLFGQMFDL